MRRLLISFIVLSLVSCGGNLPALEETVFIEGSVSTLKGWVERPSAKSGKVPVAIILHGLTGDSHEGHLEAVADSLYSRGTATVRFDFNGHGESEGDFSNMTLDNEFGDALAIYDYVVSLPWVDKDRISLVGHSQGGLEAGLLAGELGKGRIHKVVLLAPAACICTMAKEGSMFGNAFDPEDIPPYIDFWKGTRLGRDYILSAQNLDVYGRTSSYDGPVLILQGLSDGEDLIRDSEAYTRCLKNVEYLPLEGLSHTFHEDPSIPASLAADFLTE